MLAIAMGAAHAAQLYRWVDERGRVEYRDTPPPASAGAKKVEERSVSGSAIETSTLPYSVQLAMKNFPVTLWTTKCGPACDSAKSHLDKRGVPYTEKDPQTDVDAFRKLTGSNEVPVLFVGKTQIKGYLASQYDSALDAAGYPASAPFVARPAPRPATTTAKAAAPEPKSAPAQKPAAGPAGLPPVRLFTHPQCGVPCNEAKALLAGRGVPFEEISADSTEGLAELQKVTGSRNVPALVVGQSVTSGWADTNFIKALDDAGFPRP